MKNITIIGPVFAIVFTFGIYVSAKEFVMPKKLPEHPRILFTKERQKEIEELAKSDKFLSDMIESLIKKADKALGEEPTDYRIPDGKRLLGQSRRSLDRTSVLAFAYRMSGKKEYAEKALEEMLSVCRFKDWNPSHYLDTAEMATAIGIGYDWLYDFIPEDNRKEIRESIIKHAFDTGMPMYEKRNWWTVTHNNWNEVCNCGLLISALAIAEDTPEKSETIIKHAIKSIENGLSVYKPDGAYPEGPGYWDYGCTFSGLLISTLKVAFDDDYELLKTPGFDVTGDYYMNIIGPNYLNFNYADGGERAAVGPMMFALSQFYERADYAQWCRTFFKNRGMSSGRFAVFGVVWYNPEGSDEKSRTPLASLFKGIQDIASMRTAWNDPNAAFIGFKGGDNRANHGHLDIGTFVFDSGGVRWASDMGADDYNMPAYFGAKRWDYYRNNTRSHNTLLIGDKNQDPKAVCKIISFETPENSDIIAKATCDMTKAYPGQAESVVRTVTLEKEGQFTIEDRLEGVSEKVRWGMTTKAKIEIDGKKAVLELNKKRMNIVLESNSAEKFETVSTTPPSERENQNRGYYMLASFAEPKDGIVTFKITFKLAD